MPETTVTEVAPDLFRICTFIPDFKLQFCQFLVKDDEPLLYHTGMNGLFPLIKEAVASVLDPATLRWISFSHFEADECGALKLSSPTIDSEDIPKNPETVLAK